MDVETDRLITLLFQNQNINEISSSPDFLKYLKKLGSYNVDELTKEPSRLIEEKNSILEQTQDLACKNYKTFVQTAECSREIFKQFSNTETHLDNLLQKIPNFEKECDQFVQKTRDININRRLNSLTLTRNIQILEILELPQLMSSFIKCEQYENALELTNYVRRLGVRAPDVKIFQTIIADVDKSWHQMLHQLISQLRQDLQLPRCLQIVGYLRQMDVFTEAELRLKFLQARNTWLQEALDAIPTDDVNHHLNKTIEITRVNVFSIMNQYRAIFNDDEHSPVNATRNKQLNENLIFYSWIQDRLSTFLSTLKSGLNQGGVLSIDSVMSQCMYFGLSFSRVGCDFRLLLIPIFTETIQRQFETEVRRASRDFHANMERFTLINKNSSGVLSNSKQPTSTSNTEPPETLLEFYPLAEYCNQMLSAFNEMRLCAPFGVICRVFESLEESLCSVSNVILHFYGQEQQAFSEIAMEAFSRLCVCFADHLIPYFQRCLEVLFAPSTCARNLGVSVQTLQTNGFAILDRELIIKPIRHLLPVKIQPNTNTINNE